MSASVYVVEPGETHLPYHFHHGAEEVLLVLEGTPTLRTPDGERVLAPGDVVHFPSPVRQIAGVLQALNIGVNVLFGGRRRSSGNGAGVPRDEMFI